MTDYGKLCYSATDNTSLIYKVIPKEKEIGNTTIRIPWTPQSYVCETYHVYHELTFNCSGRFTSGSGTATGNTNTTGSSSVEMVITLSNVSANAVFTINVSYNTPCSAQDTAPVQCDTFVTQQGGPTLALQGNSVAKSSSSTAIRISFNGDGVLTGVQ